DDRVSSVVYPPLITSDYFSSVFNPETNQPIILRWYQVESVNRLITQGWGIVIAGTGSGKTLVTAALANSYGILKLKTITIVPNRTLILQTKETYEMCGLDVGEYTGKKKDVDHLHVISTWQALQNNPQLLSLFRVVIVDEAHTVSGDVLTNLLNKFGKHIVHRFGVTGTLPKHEANALSVKVALGTVVYNIPASELIHQGWLAQLHINIIQLCSDLTPEYSIFLKESPGSMSYKDFKKEFFPDWFSEKLYLQKNELRLNAIVKIIEEKKSQGNVLCLVTTIEFGKKLAEMIPGAFFVHGKDTAEARKEVYDLFGKENNIAVIATVHVAGVGIDIARIFNLMYIDMGRSFIRTIQTIGRGLRKAKDKGFVNVTDICSDFKYSKRQLSERVLFYKHARYPFSKQTIDC
ncbi:MAG: DEAD/DEAH box helicase, partial [Thermodesulfobacteriota bacterium]